MHTKTETNNKSIIFSLVIPALNEESGISSIIERVLAVREPLKDVGIDELELIVVDDGSTDKTAECVKLYSDVVLVQHPTNFGYGAALKTGFREAKGHLMGFLDADGTYPPEHLAELCSAILDGADVAVGSRRSGAVSEMPKIRRVGNFLWSNLLSLLAGRPVIDPASGMRVFRRDALEMIYPLPDGLNFTPVMSTRSAHEALKVVELPIPYKERSGRSKLNVAKDGMRFLQTILWTALNYNPVRILGGVGALLVALALVIAAVLIGMRLSGITRLGVGGAAGSFGAVALGITGVNLFALGITFNYLVSLFHKRPIRQGLFGKPIFKTPLDRHFWWVGLIFIFTGIAFSCIGLVLGMQGWPAERLWLYLLTGTMMVIVGVQLFVFWLIVRVLDELSQREIQTQEDLYGTQSRGKE